MKLKYIIIALVVVLAGLFLANKMGWIGGGNITKVAIEEVKEHSITEMVTASGTITPATEVKLSSEVSGEVVELWVKEGDFVKKGQLLCKVRPDVLQSSYEMAIASYSSQKANYAGSIEALKQLQANFTNIEAVYLRNKDLFDKKVISKAEFDKAKADYLAAKAGLDQSKQGVTAAKYNMEQTGASVKQANANLVKTTIYAPVDGTVSKLSVEKGDMILGTSQMAGTEIMRISNLTTMEANVNVNENDINRISVGDSAVIQVDAFSEQKFKGLVTEIATSSSNVANTTTGTVSVDQVTNFVVKVLVVQEKGDKTVFRPGLSTSVDIKTKTQKSIAIPIQAVSSKKDDKDLKTNVDSKQYVFVLDKKKVKMVQITTGIQDDMNIIVKSGLKIGAKVVTAPYLAVSKNLKDGDEVEVVDKSKLFEKGK